MNAPDTKPGPYYIQRGARTESRMNRGADFITDNGGPFDMIADNGKPMGQVARYGVWQYSPSRGKHQVIDTGNDLKKLQEQYSVPAELVYTLKGAA